MTPTHGDTSTLFEQIGPELFAEGLVNIIDVSCIRDRALDRWDRKAAQVEDYIKRTFRKSVRDTDLLIALSDTEFAVVLPSSNRFAALSCCTRVAHETVTYFLGAQAYAPLRLLTVTGVEAGRLLATEVPQEDIKAALSDDGTSGTRHRADLRAPAWQQFSAKIGQSSRQIIQVDPKIEAVLKLEPIWHTAPGAVASFLISPTILKHDGDQIVPVALETLGPRLSAILCEQMVNFAARVLRNAEEEGRRFGLHLPVPLDAITTSRERLAVQSRFKTLPADAKQLLVVEICDCPDGMPQSRMIDVVGAVQPFCRAVLARVSGNAPPVVRWKSVGLSGIAVLVEGSTDRGGKAEMLRLTRIADAAAGPRTMITAHGLRKRESVLAAWASGFTHVSGQVITDQAKTNERPVRLSAVDIFVD